MILLPRFFRPLPGAMRLMIGESVARLTVRVDAKALPSAQRVNRDTCSVRKQRNFVAKTTSGDQEEMKCTTKPLLHGMMAGILNKYWERAPTAETVLDLIASNTVGSPVYFDHFAFRSFGVDGLGIDSLAAAFTQFGYQARDELLFPAKKLRALWFAPPAGDPSLPRVFISQLQVEELSLEAQRIIGRYTCSASAVGALSVLGSVLGVLPWPTPTLGDYQRLAEESEYAAWTLVNGYALNHAAVSVHRLKGFEEGITKLNDFLIAAGCRMNEEGGVLKVSPDGGLLQSSTVSDKFSFAFAGGEDQMVAGPYMEFAQRLPLPHFSSLQVADIEEHHRRDGFEVGNADKIFDSTRLAV